MIISVNELKEFITPTVSDAVLKARLDSIETSIRNMTHNRFQDKRFRALGNIKNGVILTCEGLFEQGDTITIDDDLRVIVAVNGGELICDEPLVDRTNALITKVVYPKDIKMGVVDVISWILANPSTKAGIASETLSRHSVSYQGNTEFDSSIGCPVRLLSFINQYKKARF